MENMICSFLIHERTFYCPGRSGIRNEDDLLSGGIKLTQGT